MASLERAIVLNGYQFVIVFYKVLPQQTSGGKLLCGGSYNGTLVSAPAWYLEWEHEVEALTQRSLKLTEINSDIVMSGSHNRRSIQPVSIPQIFFYKSHYTTLPSTYCYNKNIEVYNTNKTI